jgi:hypothetical protein
MTEKTQSPAQQNDERAEELSAKADRDFIHAGNVFLLAPVMLA